MFRKYNSKQLKVDKVKKINKPISILISFNEMSALFTCISGLVLSVFKVSDISNIMQFYFET